MQDLSNGKSVSHQKTFLVEREYLGKYSPEELMKRIIKNHLEQKMAEDCNYMMSGSSSIELRGS